MLNINTLRGDIINTAGILGVPYSENVIDRVLNAFGSQFSHQAVDLKTTTKSLPKRGLYFRYFRDLEDDKNPSCLAREIAKTTGLLIGVNQESDRLMSEIYETFPLMADGADFEVNRGFEKIWLFPKCHLSLDSIFKIKSLPSSIIHNATFLKQHNLDTVNLFGSDYYHNSANLYFVVNHPDCQTSKFYKTLLKDLQFDIPEDSSLELLVNTGAIAFTFNWTSSKIERICCYIGGFTRETLPQDINKTLNKFVENCPASVSDPNFILGYSFGLKGGSGNYIKIEVDYNGKVMPLHANCLNPSRNNAVGNLTLSLT
ncbi:MAG: aromatic prenyltransferase [Geitlerinemataceae cyanobacterium]